MVIYKTTNLVNGKQYIGKDGHNNPNYLGSGTFLKMAIKKYGKQNFKKEILEVCESEEQMRVREKYWLNYYDAANNKMFYNIHNHSYGSAGGKKNPMYGMLGERHPLFGKPRPTETRKKISDSLKGRPLSEECRKNISKSLLGHIVTEETREKLSKANSGRPLSNEQRKKLREANLGKTASEETKKKMSESGKGRVFSETHRKRLSESAKGRKLSEEQKQNLREHALKQWEIKRLQMGT